MAKFYISDVMIRNKDAVNIGYLVVVNCHDVKGNSVQTTLFVQKEDIRDADKESIRAIAEKWLNQKEGLKTVAELIADKLAIIEDESAPSLIDDKELVINSTAKLLVDEEGMVK